MRCHVKHWLAIALIGSQWSSAHAQSAPQNLSDVAVAKIERLQPIFDGETLNGWIQAPRYSVAFSAGDIADYAALAAKLDDASDPVSSFLVRQMEDSIRASLGDFPTTDAENDDAKEARSALVKELNRILSGPTIYAKNRFKSVVLRQETSALLDENRDDKLDEVGRARLNRMLLEDAYPAEIPASPLTAWTVRDGVMASLGAGRGVIYTERDYDRFRLIFELRHLGGPPRRSCGLRVDLLRAPARW